jgi:hypothetical protein
MDRAAIRECAGNCQASFAATERIALKDIAIKDKGCNQVCRPAQAEERSGIHRLV